MAIIQIGMGRLTKGAMPPVRFGGRGVSGHSRSGRGHGIGRIGQYVGAGADQANCPSGQWNSSLQVCCAPGDGSVPAMDDPCSILNSAGYLGEQAAVQQQAIAGSAGNASSTLAQLDGYSQPVQTAALTCVSNPGNTYTDNWGNVVTCPSLAVDDNGIMVSAYTAQQLAAMLYPSFSNAPTPANTQVDVTNSGQSGNAVTNSAPSNVTVTPATTNNALSNSAAQTGASGTPSASQITNGQNQSGNSTNAQGGAPASDVVIGGVDITSWVEQNWVILAAAAVGLIVVLPMLEKR